MTVNPDVDVHTKTRDPRKTLQKLQKVTTNGSHPCPRQLRHWQLALH